MNDKNIHANFSQDPNQSLEPKLASVMPSLPVKELTKSIAFYNTLGFELTFRNGDNFGIVTRGPIEIGLATHRSATAASGSCYIKLIDGIDTIYNEYKTLGIDIRHPLKNESYGMREFLIADLDGNLINFGQRI